MSDEDKKDTVRFLIQTPFLILFYLPYMLCLAAYTVFLAIVRPDRRH